MFQEEPQHLPGGIRAARIGVGTGGTAPRPCVPGTVNLPVLEDGAPARVDMERAGVGVPSWYPPTMHLRLGIRGWFGLRNDMMTVARVYCGVGIAMEDDGWNACSRLGNGANPAACRRRGKSAVPHGGESGRQVIGSPARKAGMHPDRSIE